MAKATILLVDDDPSDIEIMRLAFEQSQSPVSIVTASHGGEAIDYLSRQGPYADRDRFPPPDLVFLDLRMPVVDGFDVLRWMKDQPAKMPPVIVLSYSKIPEDVKRATELGAKGYAVKSPYLDETEGLVKIASELISALQDREPPGR
jgi:CheY-like chemotaxis protein